MPVSSGSSTGGSRSRLSHGRPRTPERGKTSQPTIAAITARTAAERRTTAVAPSGGVQDPADEVRDDRRDPERHGLEERLAGRLEVRRAAGSRSSARRR